MNRVLCFDIGGTAIKARVLDTQGNSLTERFRVLTPRPATPKSMLKIIGQIADACGAFDLIGAGFPGVVKDGVCLTAPNLHRDWVGFRFAEQLEKQLGVKAIVSNDADAQALGASQGTGVELTITLGTGVGSGLVLGGQLVPNLEMGHHPFRKGETYEEQLGLLALNRIGKSRWNRRIRKMISVLQPAFNCNILYLGGGHSKLITGKLPSNVVLVSNDNGVIGCIRLWFPHRATQIRKSA